MAEWYTQQVEGLCPKGRGGSSPLEGTNRWIRFQRLSDALAPLAGSIFREICSDVRRVASFYGDSREFRAASSAAERLLYTQRVGGSNPSPPTFSHFSRPDISSPPPIYSAPRFSQRLSSHLFQALNMRGLAAHPALKRHNHRGEDAGLASSPRGVLVRWLASGDQRILTASRRGDCVAAPPANREGGQRPAPPIRRSAR